MKLRTKFRVFFCLFLLAASFGVVTRKTWDELLTPPQPSSSRTNEPLTFTRDIAPIIFQHCAECHRPGQSAPFSLLNYSDVRKHAQEIADLTARKIMPPWLPEPGSGDFLEARVLSADQIELIQLWVKTGTAEGDPADLPPLPKWSEDWLLGTPDLIVTMAQSYTLPPEGKDLYRNFVIPLPVTTNRYVKTFEFRPGNPKVVHHAVLQIDRTPASRLLDEQDPEPGFSGGMSLGAARLPDGYFLGWTPGKRPHPGNPGMAWRMEKGADLVLQLHLRPTGKPELVQPSIGFYFTETPPERLPYALVLRSKAIDIPPGETDYLISDSYQLPVEVLALSIYPHAHYLAREMTVKAALPDGTERRLIRIKDWNFNWQDEYRYRQPVFLPKGTVITMQYSYDNSAGNPRNPNHPPQRVRYGQNSSDEMAELMIQVVPRDREDLEVLKRSSADRAVNEEIRVQEALLKAGSGEAKQQIALGRRYQQIGRMAEAIARFRQALQLEPGSGKAHYLLADALAESGQFDEALKHFQEADRRAPDQPEFLNALAQILARHPNPTARDPVEAIRLARRAVELTRNQDPATLETLAVAYASAGEFDRSVESAQAAINAATAAKADDLAAQIGKRLEAFKKTKGGRAETPEPARR